MTHATISTVARLSSLCSLLLVGNPAAASAGHIAAPAPSAALTALPDDPAALADLVELGRRLFAEETFDGNGRTCATCHPPQNHFTLDPAFIAKLPPTDPLFVAEHDPALAGLEDPVQMHGPRALILENIDGFDFQPMFRGTPHVFNVARTAPYGLSGEIATLQQFSLGAVMQHFPRSLQRIPGTDFRVPTTDELDALAAYQLSIVSPADGNGDLTRFVTTPAQQRGMTLFFGAGRCSQCHGGATLSEASPALGGGNGAFDTGVTQLPINAETPPDPPIGRREADGHRAFSTPTLFEIGNTAPYFHDNSVATLHDAVAFYDGVQFNRSPGGQAVGPIQLTANDVDDLTAFLSALTNCGNGTPDAGEGCDEGASNGIRECCSTSCRLIDQDGDGLCDADDACPHVASVISPAPTTLRRVSLRYRATGPGGDDDSLIVRDALPPLPPSFDPQHTHALHVSVTDSSTRTEILTATLAAGSRWTRSPSGARWDYADPAGPPNRVRRAQLRPDAGNRVARLRLTAIDWSLGAPAVSSSSTLGILIEIESNGEGTCATAHLDRCVASSNGSHSRCRP